MGFTMRSLSPTRVTRMERAVLDRVGRMSDAAWVQFMREMFVPHGRDLFRAEFREVLNRHRRDLTPERLEWLLDEAEGMLFDSRHVPLHRSQRRRTCP